MKRRARKKKRVFSLKPQMGTRAGVVIFVLLLCCAGTFAVYQYVLAAHNTPIPVHVDPNVGIEAQVREFFTANDAEEMIPIIKCESRFRHYHRNGSVLVNKAGSSATGVSQILTSAHPDPQAIELHNKRYNTELSPEDFDILTVEGNLAYALLLYRIRGTKDWECSKKFRFAS